MSASKESLERARRVREKLQDLVTLEAEEGPISMNEGGTYTVAKVKLKAHEADGLLAAEFDAVAKSATDAALEKAASLLDEMGENAISGGAIVLYESVAERLRAMKTGGA